MVLGNCYYFFISIELVSDCGNNVLSTGNQIMTTATIVKWLNTLKMSYQIRNFGRHNRNRTHDNLCPIVKSLLL